MNKFIKEIENLLLLAKKENYQNRILILEGMQLFLSDREEGTLIFKKQLSLLESYYDTIIVTSIENGMNEEISNQLEDIFSSKINKKNLSIKNLFVKSYIFEDLFTEKSHYIIEFDNIVSENFSVSIKNSQSKLINLKSSTNCQPYIFFDKTVHNDKKNISYIVLNNFLQEKEL